MWLILIGVGVVVVMKNPAAKQKLTDFWNSLKGKLSGGASA